MARGVIIILVIVVSRLHDPPHSMKTRESLQKLHKNFFAEKRDACIFVHAPIIIVYIYIVPYYFKNHF